MTNRQPYKFFLADSKGLSYAYKNGMVEKDNSPTPIETPIGWMEEGLSFGRNNTYYGLNRAFTGTLKFIGDSATIIRFLFYNQKGVDQDLNIVVCQWNDQTGIYEIYYKGALDFTTFEDYVAEGVQVSTMEAGLLKLLKAHESTVYQIPLDGSIPENFKVAIDGLLFRDVFTYESIAIDALGGLAAIPVNFVSNSGSNIGIEKGNQNSERITTPLSDYLLNSSNYLFKSVSATQITVTGLFNFQCKANGGSSINISFLTSSGGGARVYQGSPVAGQTININFTDSPLTINLNAGESIFLIIQTIGIFSTTINIIDQQFFFSFNSQYKNTNTYCILAKDLWKLLVQNVTGGLYSGVSTLLDKLTNYAITSGDALRYDSIPDGANKQPAVIKTCLKDFFDWIDTDQCCALSNFKVNGKDTLFLEKRSYCFDPSTITFDVGEVADLKITFYNEGLCNEVNIGYPPQQYDQVNGKQEFNTTSKFSSPVIQVQKIYAKISKYRADSYGIEFTRFNVNQTDGTTANASDNSVFVLDITPKDYSFTTSLCVLNQVNGDNYFAISGADKTIVNKLTEKQKVKVTGTQFNDNFYTVVSIEVLADSPLTGASNYNIHVAEPFGPYIPTETDNFVTFSWSAIVLNRPAYDSITGIDNPASAYNTELSPASQFYRHGSWIRSFVYNRTNEFFRFLTSDKNQLFTKALNGVRVQENADILISDLDSPMFYPLVVEFKTEVPYNFSKLLSYAANGHIQLKYNGKTFFIFPLEVKQQFALNPQQTWKGLLSPANNISDLANLDIDGLNFLDMASPGMYAPHLCPVQFVPLNNILPANYNQMHMDGFWFIEQVNFWIAKRNYFQKWQSTDIIPIQVITHSLGPVQLNVITADGTGTIVKTVQIAQVLDPAVNSPYALFEGAVTLDDLAEGVYYFTLQAGTGSSIVTYISEGQYVRASWPKTRLIEYSNSRNKQTAIFSTGWQGAIRVEGWLDGFQPGAHFSVNETQPADMKVINGIPYRIHILNIGDEYGLPPWMADKLNRIMVLDNVSFDGLGISRNGDVQFEKIEVSGWPLGYWKMEIRESKNSDGVMLLTTGELDSNVIVAYDIDTDGFGDGSDGTNIVNVTEIE